MRTKEKHHLPKRTAWLLHTVAWLLTATPDAQAQQVWSMDRCIAYAMTHATDLQKVKVESDNAHLDRHKAMAGFMPTVSANVGAQFSWGRNVDPETNTYSTVTTFSNSYTLGASLVLFDGAYTYNAFRRAKLVFSNSVNSWYKAQDDKAIEVMQKYVDAVYAEAMVTLAAQKLTDSQTLLYKTKRLAELGEKSHPDVVQAQAMVAEDDYQLLHQRNAAAIALLALKRVMGYPIDHEDDPATPQDSMLLAGIEGIDRPTTFAFVQGIGAQLQTAEFAVGTARLDYKMACAQLWPTLSVGASVSTGYFRNITGAGATNSFSRQFRDNMGEYVYATLHIPLFSFGQYQEVKKKRNDITLAKLERSELHQQVTNEYRQAVCERNGTYKEMQLLKTKVDADSLAHHLNIRKYEEGMFSTLDLQTSAQKLMESRIKLIQCQLTWAMKRRLVDYYEKGIQGLWTSN